jgi:hypothetical protein
MRSPFRRRAPPGSPRCRTAPGTSRSAAARRRGSSLNRRRRLRDRCGELGWELIPSSSRRAGHPRAGRPAWRCLRRGDRRGPRGTARSPPAPGGAGSGRAPAELAEEVVAIMSEFHPAGYRAMARAFAEADLRDFLPPHRRSDSARLGRRWRFRPLVASFGPSGLHQRALFAPRLCRYGATDGRVLQRQWLMDTMYHGFMKISSGNMQQGSEAAISRWDFLTNHAHVLTCVGGSSETAKRKSFQ